MLLFWTVIGGREVYHGWTEFCYVWLELDWSECLRQSGIWTSLNGELWGWVVPEDQRLWYLYIVWLKLLLTPCTGCCKGTEFNQEPYIHCDKLFSHVENLCLSYCAFTFCLRIKNTFNQFDKRRVDTAETNGQPHSKYGLLLDFLSSDNQAENNNKNANL